MAATAFGWEGPSDRFEWNRMAYPLWAQADISCRPPVYKHTKYHKFIKAWRDRKWAAWEAKTKRNWEINDAKERVKTHRKKVAKWRDRRRKCIKRTLNCGIIA